MVGQTVRVNPFQAYRFPSWFRGLRRSSPPAPPVAGGTEEDDRTESRLC